MEILIIAIFAATVGYMTTKPCDDKCFSDRLEQLRKDNEDVRKTISNDQRIERMTSRPNPKTDN